MPTKKAFAATLAALALVSVLLTGCSDDDHQTDANPCGDTGKAATGFDTGTTGVFDGTRSAFVTRSSGGGGGHGGGSSSSGSKGGSSSGSKSSSGGSKSWFSGAKSWFSGSKLFGGSSTTKSSFASSAFRGSNVTGSRTFTAANGLKYAVAPRTSIPLRPMMFMSPPPAVYMPGMHYDYFRWAMYGNYPGATTIIECR